MKVDSLIDKLHFTSTISFEVIPQSDLAALRKSIIKVEEKKNKVLFKEGAYPKGIYILHKGLIKIYQVNKDGDKQIIYFYGPGELLGYRPLISEEPNPVTAEALEDCVLSFIPKDNFLDVLHRSPAL